MTIMNSHFLFLLLALIPLLSLYIVIFVRSLRSLGALGNAEYKKNLRSAYIRKFFYSLLFISIGFTSLVVAIVDIRWESEYVVEQATGVDVVFVVDVSNSMMVDDVSPNRLERVKRILSLLIEEKNQCRYSLVAFKGAAVQQIPMTEDVTIFHSWLNVLSPNMITVSGTNIYDGVNTAIECFPKGKETRKLIYLFTDGGSGDTRPFYELNQTLTREKIKLIPIACGTLQGGEILLSSGRQATEQDNQLLNLPANLDFLQDIAESLSIPLYSLQDAGIVKELSEILENEIRWVGVNEHKEQFVSEHTIFLLISFFSFLMFIWIRAIKFKGVF